MEKLINKLFDLAITIQQIPAPTFAESQRGNYVQKLFKNEKLTDISTDSLGNIFGCLPGEGRGKPLIICAHLDTVFPADTNLRPSPKPRCCTTAAALQRGSSTGEAGGVHGSERNRPTTSSSTCVV